jgi:transposase
LGGFNNRKCPPSWRRGFKKKGKQAVGRGRRGWSTKIHTALSPQGLVNVVLSEGQKLDLKIFPLLCQNWPWEKMKSIIADKGYATVEIKQIIRSNGCQEVIPPKKNRCFPGNYDKQLYKTRVKIEHFFSHLKEHKRLGLRYDKLDLTFSSFICCAAMLITRLLC